MSEILATTSSKQPCGREDALAVLLRLRQAGHVAYFAGGCVRDELLGIVPKDFDVATDAPPQKVREIFSNTQAVGAAFGVILVKHKKSIVEVATFRSDGEYLDGRRPSEVHFTNSEQDAKRRDFTINGLFLEPVENKVIDFVSGRADLSARILRAIGNPSERFAEDHLRLLRAIRFAARFGLTIEPKTAEAILANAGKLASVSPERIAEELRLMFAPATRKIAWKLLRDFHLAEVIFRFAPPADADMNVFENLGDESIQLGLALAAAAVSRLKNPFDPNTIRKFTQAMRQALRLSNGELDDLSQTLSAIQTILDSPSLATKKRCLACERSPLARRLMKAMVQSNLLREKVEPLEKEFLELERTDFAPPPLLTGDELVAAGWQPGPVFKRVLDQVYDAQLENRISTKEQAIELANRSR